MDDNVSVTNEHNTIGSFQKHLDNCISSPVTMSTADKGGPPSGMVVTVDDNESIGNEDNNCCDKIFASACCLALEKAGSYAVDFMERWFYRLGRAIGKYPVAFIVGVFVLVAIMIPGAALYFEEENDPTNLWTPYGILARDHKKWVDRYYASSLRFQSLLIEADDVLTPEVIQAMYDIDEDMKDIDDWEDICARWGAVCWSNSLLELWSFDEATIMSLTKDDIVDQINNVTSSPVYFNDYEVEAVLGGITYRNGRIYKAKATTMTYFLNTSDPIDPENKVLDWEQKFLNRAARGHSDVEVYYLSSRSFGDEGGGAITDDVSILSFGYVLLICFVLLVIGNFNCIQQRVYVTLGGILCIGLAIAFAIGLCSYAQIPWGPLHSVLPFLLLGIGVDDMFVIVQCYDQLKGLSAELPINQKIGYTMKHAGMSILVTSITDICAFAVGATTILPALRSFCIYAAVGILANFLFQATLFVACVTLDQRRVQARRNAFCCCYRHKEDYEPNKCSQRSFMDTFFRKYFAPFIIKLPVKIVVFILAVGIFALNIYGVTQLEQDFDPRWFIPSDSYATEYFDESDRYFPDDGLAVNVFLGRVNYYGKYDELMSVKRAALNDRFTRSDTIDVWYDQYILWAEENSAQYSSYLDANNYPSREDNYYDLLDLYMNNGTREGQRFAQDLVFEDGVVVASRFSLVQRQLDNSREEIRAMDSIRGVCDDAGLGGARCFVYAEQFLDYEGNRVIQEELYRNLGLAFICVLIMTLILLANLWTCFLVCLCVIMSLIDVGGFMYFWGLTIDTVTTINLLIAIGLTVDYSAHVAHTFMTSVGTRNERILRTLSYIGPAVFYGGFSTFLAFILLSFSASYVFQTFFKVFFLVVIIGLFHGLFFLPVILSWAGPPAYISARDLHRKNSVEDRKENDGPVQNGDAYKTNGSAGALENPAFHQNSEHEVGRIFYGDGPPYISYVDVQK